MKIYRERYSAELVNKIRTGNIGVLLTDTIYGVVADANNETAVERIYEVRGRRNDKPCIVLISDIDQIWDQDVAAPFASILKKYWPGRVSVVLPVGSKTPPFVHRNFNQTVVFRLPDDDQLRQLIAETGPLIAPSANPEGMVPAMDINQAQEYFGDTIDFYVDSGRCNTTTPSSIIAISLNGEVTKLR